MDTKLHKFISKIPILANLNLYSLSKWYLNASRYIYSNSKGRVFKLLALDIRLFMLGHLKQEALQKIQCLIFALKRSFTHSHKLPW